MVFRFLRSRATDRVVQSLHAGVVAAIREPAHYRDFGVADTFEGRFELLALVSSLLVMRLSEAQPPTRDLAQELTDRLFQGLDDDLREMGVGDLAVPKKIKKLAASLLGRRGAYAQALADPDATVLREALARNIYGGVLPEDDMRVAALARWVQAVRTALQGAPDAAFASGEARLPRAEMTA